MKHLHRKVILSGLVAAGLVAGAYALLGIGFAAIVAVGLFIAGAIILVAVVMFEEETRLTAVAGSPPAYSGSASSPSPSTDGT